MGLMEGRHSDPWISVDIHHGWHSLGLSHVTLAHTYEPAIPVMHEDREVLIP